MFAFQLGQTVTREWTTAKIIGRAEYNYSENRYQVVRMDDSGKTLQEWWSESDIKPSEPQMRQPR